MRWYRFRFECVSQFALLLELDHMLALTIVTPTYNESDTISDFLHRLAAAAAKEPDVAVRSAIVDDSSPDGTADVVRRLSAALATDNFSVTVLQRKQKEGLGAAYRWAFRKILGESTPPDFIIQMDADLSHDPKYISDLLREARDGADFVVASRYIPGGATPDWSLTRRVLSRGGNLYARIFLRSRLTDYTGGFNLFSRELLERLDVNTITVDGYGFQIALKHKASVHATQIREVPIVFLDRAVGTSKLPKDTMLKSLILVPRLRLSKGEKR